MTAPQSTVSPTETPRKNNLNMTQVAAAALAAVTAALLGSQLGAAGTLIGAAGASVVTTVGTALYSASLERSRERVRALAQRTRALPTSRAGAQTEPAHSALRSTPSDDESSPGGADGQTPPQQSPRRFISLRYGAAVVAALGAFVLAMMVITGFEWASGETLGGNGKGTTIARVVDSPSGPQAPDPATPPAPSSSSVPTSEEPARTGEAPEPSAPTSTPSEEGTSEAPKPSETVERPEPSTVTPPTPLVPGLPGIDR
ncbi:MAG TPA: hypothetical protein VHH34_19975 [Pseudonocardiaceae bacterium]|nr:hypothetical protein [Pseudonocardiaceae bacterium]